GEEARQIEQSGPRPARVEERAISALGQCLMHADHFDEARRLLERALAAADEEGDDSSLTLLVGYLAYLECWTGNWQKADQYATQCQEAGEQVEQRARSTTHLTIRALIDAHLGRIDAARAAAGEALKVAAAAQDIHVLMVLHGILGFADLSAGNLE